LDKAYDRVRDQLRNPDKTIYPLDFWFAAPFPKDVIGAPLVIEKDLESILPTFVLKTDFSERMFSAVVPLTTRSIEEIIQELKDRFAKDGMFPVALDLMDQADYLSDIEAIKQMLH